MSEKLKPIGDCIFDERGLIIDKSGNINCSIVGVLRDITSNSAKLLNSNDEVTIEIVFEKTALLIQQNQGETITAASFNEIKK